MNRTQTHLILTEAMRGTAGGPPPNTAPVITGQPTVSGTVDVGETLTATPASVTGNPTPTRTWQWYREATLIGGATSITYDVQEADRGSRLKARQIETNTEGSDTSDSDFTVSVPLAPGTEDQTVWNHVRFAVARAPDYEQTVWNHVRFAVARAPDYEQTVWNHVRFVIARAP